MADETAKVRYVGPYDAVQVPSLGITVKQGEAVEVPLADAAALALQEHWQAVGKSAEPIAEAQAALADAPTGVAPQG